ncbi:MAG: sugar transferase [Parcubacteria group bacterium]|nr:sugar transferase [Parcubacteria group bacterium]
MIHGGPRASALLFLGDIATFALSLWITLLIRYRELPTEERFFDHIVPFTILFALWALIFYMSGLYGKRIILFKSSLPNAIVKTQFFNIVLAALFFFLVPGVGIAPKTNLVIYLVVSLVLIFTWRLGIYPKITIPRTRYQGMLIAEGGEAEDLLAEVNGNRRYHLRFCSVATPAELDLLSDEELNNRFSTECVDMVVADGGKADVQMLLPRLYALPALEKESQFIDFADMYEEVFDRIPLSLLHQGWFMQNVSARTPILYAVAKRIIDIVGGLAMALATLIAIPFIWFANALEGKGPLFIVQDRIGARGSHVRTLKFRSMTANDAGAWHGETENRVTKVGEFLRLTSLDEFPQCLNVLKGELSLIGPRNDMTVLGNRLAEALPYYTMRYLVKPGITGWAQINQQYEQGNISPQSVEETKVRLAYDFYYIKHRSLGLDIVIALKTIKRMFFRVSSW